MSSATPEPLEYSAVDGHYDEMTLPSGELRPHWKGLVAALQRLGREELFRRWREWDWIAAQRVDLEVPLGTVRRASELLAAYAGLPLTKDVAGRHVSLRARALRLARALEASESAYRAGPFREHDVEIARAAKELSARLLPNVDTILRKLEIDMALPGASRPIVVTLVGDAPYPGIFAADARGQKAASFVRVRGLEGGALCEAICIPTGIEPPLYRRRVDFYTKSRAFDIGRAQREIGYAPRVGLRDGIARTLGWYRDHGWL